MTVPKQIHFFELTLASLPRACVCKLLGFDVSYFRISDSLARSRMFKRCGRFGFLGLSYAAMPSKSTNAFFRRSTGIFVKLFDDCVRLTELQTAIDVHFGLDPTASGYAWRGLRQRLQMRWFEFALLADYLSRAGSGNPSICLPPGQMAREIADVLWASPRVIRAGLLDALGVVVRFAATIAKQRWQAIAGRFGRRERQSAARSAGTGHPLDLGSYEVLYFPHKGVTYGKLFAKTHYYAADPTSPFYPNRILHLAASTLDAPTAESLRYYEYHGLAYDNLERWAPSSIRWELLTLASFLRLAVRSGAVTVTEIWRWNGYRIFAYYFVFRLLAKHIHALRSLPRARVALVGYDLLFSPWLAAALSKAGIRTVATQERFILPFYGHLDAFVDHYLVCGERIRKEIKVNPLAFGPKEIAVVGPPRAHEIGQWANRAPPDAKYVELKRTHFLILALDYHTPTSWDEDRMARVATWDTVLTFYRDLIRLATMWPAAYIVIKGKDLSNLNNPHLAEVVEQIVRQPNMEFETAIEKFVPSYMAAVADLAIALHTSLGDEMLANGKNCLFYDRTGFLDDLYDYDGFPVVVRKFDDLAKRVGLLIDKRDQAIMPQQEFESMRQNLYGQNGRPWNERIQPELNAIFIRNRAGGNG